MMAWFKKIQGSPTSPSRASFDRVGGRHTDGKFDDALIITSERLWIFFLFHITKTYTEKGNDKCLCRNENIDLRIRFSLILLF